MRMYGWEVTNKEDRGCCPGHDKVYFKAWSGRHSNTAAQAKRLPKKRLRQQVRKALKAQRTR